MGPLSRGYGTSASAPEELKLKNMSCTVFVDDLYPATWPEVTRLMGVATLLEMEHLKDAYFRHVSAHFIRLQPVIFMHKISSDNTEEFTISCMIPET